MPNRRRLSTDHRHRRNAFKRSARRTFLCTLAAAMAVAGITSSRRARAATPQEVKAAIEKGRKYLLEHQLPGGHWEPDAQRQGVKHDWEKKQGDSYGGFTAVCTYALLAAGEKPQSEKVAAAIDFLKKCDMVGIYSIGLRCQVWYLLPQPTAAAPAKEYKALLTRDLTLLENGINAQGPNRGMWDYGDGHGDGAHAKGRLDHSVSQYGVLGLWALEEAGAEIDRRYWELLDSVWREHQFPDGGWVYDGTPNIPSPEKRPVTASMTAAGVATLFITQDMLHGQEGATCNGNLTDKHIDAGLKWMSDHFDQVKDNYALYGVERIGVASGYKYFGNVDWYAEGANRLVKSQHPDGSWTSTEPGAGPLQDTAFALLFLSRGSAPIMLNKLDYREAAAAAPDPAAPKRAPQAKAAGAGGEVPWDQRPRDAANLAKFVGHQTEGFLNWQIVNLASPVEDWHDAPILYLAGNKPLKLSEADEAKLKLFAQQGGLIVGNADCAADKTGGLFGKSFRELGTKLFGTEFRELPMSHVLFTEEQYHSSRPVWKNRPPVAYGLTNGVRELMVLLPLDAARAWQTDAHVTRAEQFELAADLYQYMTERQTGLIKGQTYLVKAIKPAAATLRVARLQVGDNPDPEPGGWPRMDAVLRNGWGVGVAAEPVKLGQNKLAGYKVAHLTGTTRFKLDEAKLQELKDFVEKGGTLVVDAAGGSGEFASAADKELPQLAALLGGAGAPSAAAGGAPATVGPVIPAEDPLYTRADARIAEFGYRAYCKNRLSGKLNVPRVQGLRRNGRLAVLYSREDLSAGMVGETVDGVLGYDPATATAIMRNILLNAEKPATAAPMAPATAPVSLAPAKKAGK